MTQNKILASYRLGESHTCGHGNVGNCKQENTGGDAIKDHGNLETGYRDADGNVEDNKNAPDHGFHSSRITEANGQHVGESYSFSKLQVTWMDGSKTMNHPNDVTIVDRGFLLGDLVALSTDTMRQLGKVMNINIAVDLLAPTGEVIKNVSSRDLRRVRKFAYGDYVVNGNWLGRVDTVLDDVTVLFDDGSVCKVLKANYSLLKPVSKIIADNNSFPYYPGLRVRAISSSVFKDSTWFSGLWKVNSLEGTVTKVQIGSVFVHWIASAIDVNPVAFPSEEQNPKDLMLLSCSTHTNWRLGDSCLVSKLEIAPTFAVDSSSTGIHQEHIQHCTLEAKLLIKDAVGESVAGSIMSSEEGNHEDTVKWNCKQDIRKTDEAVLNEACKFDELKSVNLSPESVSHRLTNCYGADSTPSQKENDSSEPTDACFAAGFCCSSVPVSEQHTLESSIDQQQLQNLLFNHGEKLKCQESEDFEHAFLITKTMTRVDVIWQDGMKQFGLDSVSLIPVDNIGHYEFFPEQYVVEALNVGENASESRRIAIVRSMNSKERTVNITWLNSPGEFQHLTAEEVASVYEFYAHPHYDYLYGDVVTPLPLVSISADSTTSQAFDEEESLNSAKEKCDSGNMKDSSHNEGHAFDGPPAGNAVGLSCFGRIIDLKDGDIEVEWGDGRISMIGPQEIYVVSRETDKEISVDESDHSGDDSWEATEGESMITYESAGEDYFLPSPNETYIERAEILHEGSSQRKGGPLSMAARYIASLASSILSLGLNEGTSSSHMTESDDSEEEQDTSDYEPQVMIVQNVTRITIGEFQSQGYDSVNDYGQQVASTTARDQTRTETSSTVTELRMDGNLNYNEMTTDMDLETKNRFDACELDELRHFDMVKDPFDHHFLGGSMQACGGKKWAKRIQQEWTILEKNLPDAIFVKVFEERLDLLRAVIIGACGTPYQDGLFFFDFCFLPEFPQVPPTAYYHSKGLRINPNLYEDGKVCLSLLNTWTGKGNEVWDPSSSSILQVLISLQGLVLNSKPYFNEPGYEKQMGSVEGERNSLSYNEHTFLLNLKSVIYVMQNPPMHFEKFVKEHFHRRGQHILNACDAYLKGCPVGSLTRDACWKDESWEQPCSAGFKLILAKITPKLFSALRDAGAECHKFEHLLSS